MNNLNTGEFKFQVPTMVEKIPTPQFLLKG